MAGLTEQARYVAFVEEKAHLDDLRSYVKHIPLDKALDDNTLLVVKMNGEWLPRLHGGPLRMLVPGWAGTYHVKWVKELAVLEKPWRGRWMHTQYHMPNRPTQPGERVSSRETHSIRDLAVNSMITRCSAGTFARPGTVVLSGYAWSGGKEIAAVEFSLDGGKRWQNAQLEPVGMAVEQSLDGGRSWRTVAGQSASAYTWTRWQLAWRADRGRHHLRVRARDMAGRVQPLSPDNWNAGGYGWNSAPGLDFTVL